MPFKKILPTSKKDIMIKRIIIIVAITCFSGKLFAQPGPDSIKNEIKRINTVYDSAAYLAFDVTAALTSDTSSGYYENDQDLVTYMLNGKNCFYSTKEAEYVQDDSFAITTFREEHTMYLTKTGTNTKELLPMKGFNDSSLYYYFLYYHVSLVNNAQGQNEITMTTDSTWALYKKNVIKYRPENHYMINADFYFSGVTSEEPEDSFFIAHPEKLPVLSKKLSMQFSNYRFMTDGSVFNYKNYVWFDRTRKEFIAKGAYKGYRVITTNLPETTNYLNE